MITSINNPRVREIKKLLESSRQRRASGLFVTEGIKLFSEAPVESIDSVYVSESFLEREGILPKLKESGYIEVSDPVYRKMSDTETPQGILCLIKADYRDFSELVSGNDKALCERILLLEGIQDPGNLGTMLRTAEAAGYGLIVTDKNTVDVYNPKVIRASMGAVFRVMTAYEPDIKNAVRTLKEKGVRVYAAHLKGNESFDGIEYARMAAVIIGNESGGLTEETSDLADSLIKIPMKGKTESLNAAVAASLIMYASRTK
ncbi:MAG: RNA methyltransferase [Lachnospiraceae bacterium]|nr:RNA methyltransferase [Lachnospiraceae bacterium]